MSDLEVWLFMTGLFSIPFIFSAIINRGKPQKEQKEETAPVLVPTLEARPFSVFLPTRRPTHLPYRRAGATVTGAALLEAWHSDLSSSPFKGEKIEMEDTPFPTSHDFEDCSLPTGIVDIVHGGIDPTGQSGLAGDFDPSHYDEMYSHSDPFDNCFGSTDFSSFDNDSFGSCDSFGTDSFSCGGIGFDD